MPHRVRVLSFASLRLCVRPLYSLPRRRKARKDVFFALESARTEAADRMLVPAPRDRTHMARLLVASRPDRPIGTVGPPGPPGPPGPRDTGARGTPLDPVQPRIDSSRRAAGLAVGMLVRKVGNQPSLVFQKNRLIRDGTAVDLGDDVAGAPLRGDQDHFNR